MEAGDLVSLVNASSDPLYVINDAGEVLFSNAAAAELAAILGARALPAGALPAVIEPGSHARVQLRPSGRQPRQYMRTIEATTWRGRPAWRVSLRDVTNAAAAESYLTRINRLYAAFGQTVSAVARATGEGELLEDACRIAVAFGGFRLAWIARASHDRSRVESVVSAGLAAAYLDGLSISIDPTTKAGQNPVAQTLRTGLPYHCNDIAKDTRMAELGANAAAHGLASCVVCPIRTSGTVSAALVVYSSEVGYFDSDLLTLLNQVASEISGGLDRLAIREARQRAEQALLESETRFRQMAAANRQVFWMRDVETGAMLYVSPAFPHVFGRPLDQAMSDPDLWTEAVHPDDRLHAEASYRRSLKEGVETVDHFRIVRPDKSERWVEMETFPIFQDGRLVRLTGNVTDITDRREAEEEARLMRSLVSSSSEGIFILRPDEDFRLVFINEAGLRHFRWPAEEMQRMKVWDWNPQFQREDLRRIWERMKEAGSVMLQTGHLRGDGTTVEVETTLNYVRHGSTELIACFVRDISTRAEAERILRADEEKFRVLFSEAADALLIINPENAQIIDCNDRAIELFEMGEKRDLLGDCRNLLPIGQFSDDDLVAIFDSVGAGGRWARDVDYVSRKGRRFYGAVAIRKASFGDRSVYLVRVSDVTERRRLVELLTHTQRLASIGSWEYLIDSGELNWTDEIYRIHELPVGAPITLEESKAFFHESARDMVEEAIREAVDSGNPWRLKLRLVTARGREIWVQYDGRVDESGGKRWRIYGNLQNITHEHLASLVLKEREERLREQAMLLDEANDAIILRGLDQTIQFWSRGAENLFGWTRAEAQGRKATLLHYRDSGPGEEAMLAVISEGIWAGEVELHTKSGRKVLVESRWTLIRDPSGTPKAILDLSTDVTEKRRVEAGMLRAQRLENIGTLAGGIAHDLNNILAPIILSADMLRSRVEAAEDRELVESIGTSARRGADVVRQVLSFARGAESTRVPLNVRHLFPEIRKIVSETFPRNIKCRTVVPADLWTIHADPTQLHQVLLNLCLNARDAMPDGGTLRLEASNVEIDLALAGFTKDARPGSYVQIKVSDTGTGIPAEIREQIFDPFFTTKPPSSGTGLGLSTLKAIVRGHGGFVQLETTVGAGTTFIIHFPAEARAMPVGGAQIKPELPRGRGELILVIDDEKSVGSITRQSLESAGFRAIVAGDGAEGVSLFVQHQRDIALVLTDLMMPVMDGAATIRAIHRISPTTRIVAMSGIAYDHLATSGSSTTGPSDVVSFLLKPFTLESLLSTVQDALTK